MQEAARRRYQVLEVRGRGGFGTVYRARARARDGDKQGRVVALKVPNATSARGPRLLRLRDEARILSMLRHHAIVTVDELVQLGGRWTIVMEYVHGANLQVITSRLGAIPPAAAATIVAEVAGALHAAYHTPGPDGQILQLRHRDVKPSNVVLTPEGEVKVLDFGIAWAAFEGRETHTQDTGVFGSPEYMAPERIDGVDHPMSDVYSLGAVLYELLVGAPLGRTFAARDRAAGVTRHGQLRAEQVVGAGPLAGLLAEMLAYDPHLRPPLAEVAARVLEASPTREPTLADWAAENIPLLVHVRAADLPTAEFPTGALILGEAVERLPAPSLPATAVAATPWQPRWVIGALCVVLAAGAAALFFGRPAARQAPPEQPLVQKVDPLPEPALLPEPVPEVTPDPEPAPAPGVDVAVVGGAHSVVLRRGDRRYPVPGRVPQGSYVIEATLPGLSAANVGRVSVGSDPVTLACDALFAVCEAR